MNKSAGYDFRIPPGYKDNGALTGYSSPIINSSPVIGRSTSVAV